MAHDRAAADAILTEHFQYTPLSVIDDVIDSVNNIVYKALSALESGLLAQAPRNLGFGDRKSSKGQTSSTANASTAAETARAEIENGVHALETLLYAAVDKNFDIFELFALQNIFTIRPDLATHVQLPHYDGAVWPVTDDGNAMPTPRRIRQLRTSLRAERELGLLLEWENKTLDAVLESLHGMTTAGGSLGVLSTATSEGGTRRLATSAQFSTSQLPGLKVLLADLKAKMALLPATAEELRRKNIPRATSEDERRRYVEGVAKRAVREKLGSTAAGERDLGPARRIDDVEALEELVSGIVRDGAESDVD